MTGYQKERRRARDDGFKEELAALVRKGYGSGNRALRGGPIHAGHFADIYIVGVVPERFLGILEMECQICNRIPRKV
ncbi:MAG: hypothetical protein R3C01_13260 [Planctomycetaceae bacterium]